MKRKTLVIILAALAFAAPVFAQDLEDHKDCTGGAANASAAVDALYQFRGRTPPTNGQKRARIEAVLQHFGVDTASFTNAENGCMFLHSIWRDARERYLSSRRAARQAERQAAIDTDVTTDLSDFDG